jgi:hypothetical protein
MKARILLLLIVLLVTLSYPGLADWNVSKNVTQRSTISLRGYMDEIFIYQTEEGLAGSKLVYGSQGSGTATRTVTSYVDECEISFNVQGEFFYHPYTPKIFENDLRSALRAKNREVGTIIRERNAEVVYLIEDDASSEKDGLPVREISSQDRRTAILGGW